MALRGPDFFIVGAPKCGTTALTDYLGQHPEIGMCALKETHYFATDLTSRSILKQGQSPPSPDEYLELFRSVQDRRRLGEASGWYLYSSVAAKRIKDYCPDARIIAMVRNPVEMLPSLHSQLVYLDIEPIEDFQQALARDGERERLGAPKGFVPRSYRAAVAYAEQLERYLAVFGRDKVHVIVYDDLRADTLGVYRQACGFLGVDADFTPSIEVVNPNKRVRSPLMRHFVRRPPESFRRVLHAVSSEGTRRAAGLALKRWNTRFTPRGQLPDAAREALRPLARQQADELQALLGLQLPAWRE